MHGEERHSSTSSSQFNPFQPGSHSQTYFPAFNSNGSFSLAVRSLTFIDIKFKKKKKKKKSHQILAACGVDARIVGALVHVDLTAIPVESGRALARVGADTVDADAAVEARR